MIKWLIRKWKARKLQEAKEQYAYWKAKHESLAKPHEAKSDFERVMGMGFFEQREMTEAAAQEAKYMERVETLIREQ